MVYTVKPVLDTTCIKRPPDLKDHCSDTATLLKSTYRTCIWKPPAVRDHFHYFTRVVSEYRLYCIVYCCPSVTKRRPSGSMVSVSDSGPGVGEFQSPVEVTFLSDVFSPFSEEACEKSSRDFGKRSCVSTGVRKPGNTYASPTTMMWP